jgi:hypothetical protein
VRGLLARFWLVLAIGCGGGGPPEAAVAPGPAQVSDAGVRPGLVRGGTCYRIEAGDPQRCAAPAALVLGPEVAAAVEGCVRAGGEAPRGGRLTVIAAGEDRAILGRPGDDAERLCLQQALATAAGADRACTLALVPGGPIDAPPWAARLEVTRSQVALDGQHVIHTHLLEPDALPVETARQLEAAAQLADRNRAGGLTDLVVRAHPAVDGGVVARAIAPFVRASGPRLLLGRAVGLSEVWAVVNPLGSSNDLRCRMAPLAVEVVPGPDRFEVRAGGRAITLPGRPAEALAALPGTLAELRAAQPDRVDLGLTLTPGVAYRDLLQALEIAVAAGYWDVRVRGADPDGDGW